MNTAKYSVFLWVLGSAATSWAGRPQVPNADFTRGDQTPAAWELQGSGDWRDRQVLAMHGEGQDTSAWWTRDVPMQAGHRYHYPPLAAAVPGHAGDEPVIAPPVSSIRWEMLREAIEELEARQRGL